MRGENATAQVWIGYDYAELDGEKNTAAQVWIRYRSRVRIEIRSARRVDKVGRKTGCLRQKWIR